MSKPSRLAKFYVILWCACLAGCGLGANHTTNAAQRCFENNGKRFNEVLACYRAAEALQPLVYGEKEITQLPGVLKWHYELMSQTWTQDEMVKPGRWKHDIDIYIPDAALTGRALIIANNGINIPIENEGKRQASDFTEATAVAIARQTNTIVVSVSDVPNQYLTYTDDGIARREDSGVAHS